MTRRCDFNPRAPCGARQLIRFPDRYPNAFQSTRPMRGATGGVPAAAHLRPDFNPRAPCGARLAQDHRVGFFSLISIHAPRAGRDPGKTSEVTFVDYISIHAPHAGRDSRSDSHSGQQHLFQSTHPSRGATADKVTERLRHEISIHAPHAGRDDFSNASQVGGALFQSTRPVRARRAVRIQPVSAA